ncbi:hypothetical protein Dsin_024898 [Dipteronia sinensis]|uniref:t-SNARE coiled-coil homology domain-containing protein n=1 Tax=Dipteronia sinensis TaxID=43782 RepID=A0AAD9ZWB4_9ROSI|nr:hypothetical protein Dsin_024898 [Dipteronia sinensis]
MERRRSSFLIYEAPLLMSDALLFHLWRGQCTIAFNAFVRELQLDKTMEFQQQYEGQRKYNFRTSNRGVRFRDLGTMNPRRDFRNNKVSLFDGIEEGGIRASASYSHEIDEHDNERAVEGLQDRVNLLKRLSGDINEEVETHNRMLDRMGNEMDSSRGILSGTMDKFKMVFETKSSRKMFTLVASFVVIFLIVYYLTR